MEGGDSVRSHGHQEVGQSSTLQVLEELTDHRM